MMCVDVIIFYHYYLFGKFIKENTTWKQGEQRKKLQLNMYLTKPNEILGFMNNTKQIYNLDTF